MSEADSGDVTRLLLRWRQGDDGALEALVPLVYDELRRLAARYLGAERSDHTLQPTALVHEAYARLVSAKVEWNDRVHFFAVAAGLMRRILVDHAKTRRRVKRGGGAARVSLDEVALVTSEPSVELLALDRALTRMAAFDERKSKVVELHFFGGLTYDETAAALGVSQSTVLRELRLARAWLHREMERGEAG
jgi:RNA polymerase sigma factor (TIGR02999 family)